MLLDVLSGFDELQVAVSYVFEGRRTSEMPASLTDFERYRPIYETLPGWQEDLTGIKQWSDLPKAAKDYVEFFGRQVGIPVSIVSVGPERRQTILMS